MADPYQKVKGGRLTFKGGALASLSKSIDKKKNKKNKNKDKPKYSLDEASEFLPQEEASAGGGGGDGGEGSAADKTTVAAGGGGGGEIYTIDAAKRMNYEELFPVEAKKKGYDPKSSNVRSAEDALDDRVKKKADRYCK